MKNKLLVLGAMVCLIAILAAGTLAYFTTSATVHNIITTDSVDIEIVETTVIDGKEVSWPQGGIEDVMPDTSVVKKVYIDNITSQKVWVRVKLIADITGADGKKLPEVDEELNVSVIQYPIASAKWVYNEADGCYYYTEPVAGGAETELLIEKVVFAPEMDNDYQNADVVLTVQAQAVQVANNELTEGETVITGVEGWPDWPED